MDREKLVDPLVAKDFARRFYALFERLRGNRHAVGKTALTGAIRDTGIPFAYNAKEKFFSSRRAADHVAVYSASIDGMTVGQAELYDMGMAFNGLWRVDIFNANAALRNLAVRRLSDP
jgi:hypothetical protein